MESEKAVKYYGKSDIVAAYEITESKLLYAIRKGEETHKGWTRILVHSAGDRIVETGITQEARPRFLSVLATRIY